jgi:hypothetical protein
VGIRFTEKEADLLCRLAKEGSLSGAVRKAVTSYIAAMGGPQVLLDTDAARRRRERRKAKRMTSPEGAAQVAAEEEAVIDKLEEMLELPSPRQITVQIERVPYPSEGKVVNIHVVKPADHEA